MSVQTDVRDELLATILRTAPVGILIIEPGTLRILLANEQMQRILDPEWRDRDLTRYTVADLFVMAPAAQLRVVIDEVVRTGVAAHYRDQPYDGFARGRTYWDYDITPLCNEAGLLRGDAQFDRNDGACPRSAATRGDECRVGRHQCARPARQCDQRPADHLSVRARHADRTAPSRSGRGWPRRLRRAGVASRRRSLATAAPTGPPGAAGRERHAPVDGHTASPARHRGRADGRAPSGERACPLTREPHRVGALRADPRRWCALRHDLSRRDDHGAHLHAGGDRAGGDGQQPTRGRHSQRRVARADGAAPDGTRDARGSRCDGRRIARFR